MEQDTFPVLHLLPLGPLLSVALVEGAVTGHLAPEATSPSCPDPKWVCLWGQEVGSLGFSWLLRTETGCRLWPQPCRGLVAWTMAPGVQTPFQGGPSLVPASHSAMCT